MCLHLAELLIVQGVEDRKLNKQMLWRHVHPLKIDVLEVEDLVV